MATSLVQSLISFGRKDRERATAFWQQLKLPERRLDRQSSLLRRRHFRSSLHAHVSRAVSYGGVATAVARRQANSDAGGGADGTSG